MTTVANTGRAAPAGVEQNSGPVSPPTHPINRPNTGLAAAGLAFAMVLLGLIPIPTAALFKLGADALEVSTARSVIASVAALLIATIILLARALRGKALLTKDTTVTRATSASIGVGIVFFVSGYAYIASLEAGLHVSYTLLTVAAVAMVVARACETRPVSDRYVFTLTMLLVIAALLLGTNVTSNAYKPHDMSLIGFALAAVSGIAFGLLPRALFAARALDSTLIIAIGFTVSAAAQVGLVSGLGMPLVILPAVLADPEFSNPHLFWTLANGFAFTYLPYAITNWAKRRGVTDSTMAFAYQLEPATATLIAAPIIGQPLTLNVLLCCGFAFLAFVLFAKHETAISLKDA